MKHTMKFFSVGAAAIVAAALIGCAGSVSAATATVEPAITPLVEPVEATPTANGSDVTAGGSVQVGPDVTGLPATETEAAPQDGGQTSDVINITMDYNGKTVTMHVGQEFLLFLEGGVEQPERLWSLDISNQDVFSRVMGIMVIKGAQGLFKVNQAGTSTLKAVGDMPCRTATPPCMTPSLIFQVTIDAQ